MARMSSLLSRSTKFAYLLKGSLVLLISAQFMVVEAVPLRIRYQPEMDSVSLEAYFTNDRLYNSIRPCLLEKGNCNTIGRWLKPRLPKILDGDCPLCTTKQKSGITKGIKYIKANKSEELKELKDVVRSKRT